MSLKALNNAIERRVYWYSRLWKNIRGLRDRIVYRLKYASKYPTQENLILFESYWGKQFSDSPKALFEEMLRDQYFKDYSFIWVFKDPDSSSKLVKSQINNDRINFVQYQSEEFFAACSSAKYIIRNVRFPDQIIRKKDQVHIQTWHGTPLKRLVHDVVVDPTDPSRKRNLARLNQLFDRDTKKYSYFLSPSKYATDIFRSAFRIEKFFPHKDIMVEEGYPRNDYLINCRNDAAEVSRIKSRLGICSRKKVVLYAPTWRDGHRDESLGFTHNLHLDFDRLSQQYKNTHVFVFRTHYHIASNFDFERYGDFIVNASDYHDINHLYLVSDALITDYSSVFFDYANLERPILFYMYDLEEYRGQTRGFYLEIEDLPGPIARTEEELMDALSRLEEYDEHYRKHYRAFNDRFNYLDDGKASQRVISRIFKDNI